MFEHSVSYNREDELPTIVKDLTVAGRYVDPVNPQELTPNQLYAHVRESSIGDRKIIHIGFHGPARTNDSPKNPQLYADFFLFYTPEPAPDCPTAILDRYPPGSPLRHVEVPEERAEHEYLTAIPNPRWHELTGEFHDLYTEDSVETTQR